MERLLERDAVLAELGRCQRSAARGQGRAVLVRGEAGVGKTMVIARFLAGLDKQVRAVRGWCDALATPRPLGPLIDMLVNLSGEQAARVRAAIAAGDPEGIYARLMEMFARDSQPWVWVIEDAHWADGATLDLLRFLARRIESLPVLLLVSYRDDEIGAQHPLAVLLGDVATWPAVRRIGLDRLGIAAVTQLAADSGVNADQLYRLTGGNPFFVTEVLAAGSDTLAGHGLPRSVSEAVAGRLARLSAAARDTAEAVAVCGPRAEAALVAAVCPDAATGPLGECLDAGVLVADADTIGFRHELARRATADQIPEHQRRILHKQILTALAEPPIDPNTLAALVFHAEQAGDNDAVISYGPKAVQRASALGAHRQAAELYALVLRHADSLPAERKVKWLEQHAFSSYVSGLTQTSVEWLREAIAQRHELGDQLAEGDDLRWISQMLYPLGRRREAIEAGRAALRLLENLGPTPQLAWSLINLAELAAFGYDPACADYAERAVALGKELGDPAVLVRARCSAPLAAIACRDSGWEQLEAVWREAMATDAVAAHAGVAGMMLCLFVALHHDVTRAERYLTEASEFCAAHDLGAFHAFVTGAAGLVALHRGDWAGALSCADDVLTRRAMSPSQRLLPLITRTLVRARRGQPAAGMLDEALAATEPDDLFRFGPVSAARAEAAWLAGDDDTAREEALAGLSAVTSQVDPWVVGQLGRWARLAGDDGQPIAGDPATPYHLESRGDWQGAAAVWIERGCPYDAAIAQLGGDIAAVQTALDTFHQLGARAAARRARQRLAHLRGRNPDPRRAATRVDPHGLTQRERDVLELVVAGHSDTEIASALHISPKTANSHVCSIMTKLGVHTRKAAARVYQQPSVSP